MEDNGITVTASANGITSTISSDDAGLTMDNLLDMFHRVSLGLTYQESSWREAVVDMAHLYACEDEQNTTCTCRVARKRTR